MLGVFASSILMSCTGFYVIRKIIQKKVKLLNKKNIVLILFISAISTLLRKAEYTGIETFIIFILNILIYKVIFNIRIEESAIVVGIIMILFFINDLVVAGILKSFVNTAALRGKMIFTIISTAMVCTLETSVILIGTSEEMLQKFFLYCQKRRRLTNIVFFIFIVLGFCILAYNMGKFYDSWNTKYTINLLLTIVLGIISYIFIRNINNFNELTDEYDNLFSYVQNFEDWIEKEQLNRHEYKNQLAVLYCLTKEKKVKDKITEILEDNINIADEVINQLKKLPKGGIKGLMYYKAAIAEKKKIKVTADVSLESKSLLKKLSEKDLRIVCKLIGIYLDNAIEAAEETRKKKLLIEVYELPNKVCFVLSNTFKMQENFFERNNKGISSKGEGRGNGLYFASKLIKSNDWLESKQDIIDNYYIQQLIIKRNL